MNWNLPKILICVFSLTALTGCEKKNKDFSDIPYLEWTDHEFETIGNPSDNRRNIILKTYFNDRDGDIGIHQHNISTDSCDFSSYNYFVKYFEKVSGEYIEVHPADSCLPFHNTLPYLTPEGQNKVLEGEINLAFSYLAFPKFSNVDSIKFEIQIKDRAGNYSNLVESAAIPIR